MSSNSNLYGKFRGIVTDASDPQVVGRVRVRVPDVLGDSESTWALPSIPSCGCTMLPRVGTMVWVEFEHGDPGYPIWVGYFKDPNDDVNTSDVKIEIGDATGHRIILDNQSSSSGIVLETSTGQRIVMNSSGIEIDNGQGAKILLQGNEAYLNAGLIVVQ